MNLWKRFLGDCTGCKQLKNDLADQKEDLDRMNRAMDNLQLDMSAVYDKVNAALARISTRAARAKASDTPDGGNGRVSADDINEMIRNGSYDGTDRL